MIDIIFKSSTSVTYELKNSDPYTTDPYDIVLNGKTIEQGAVKNIVRIGCIRIAVFQLIGYN